MQLEVELRRAATSELADQPSSVRLRPAARERVLDLLPRGLVIAPLLLIAAVYARMHYFLCDDAFISFRYARNLVAGHGLVFNIGERVEGYSNFLWVIELATIWKVLGVRPEHASVALSALFSAGTLLVTALLARRTPFARSSFAAVAAALLLLAVNRNFAVWATSGLETRQCTFLVLLAILLQHRAQRRGHGFLPASLAWAAAALTRPDAQLLFACAVVWELVRGAVQRKLSARSFGALVGPALLVIGAHLLFRHAYYGEWLPNTYYAKNVRPWPEAGLSYLTAAALENGLYVVAPLALLGAFARFVVGRDDLHAFALPAVALHAAYWAWIGGDHFEFRPMDAYWPLLALAAVDGWLALSAAFGAWMRRREVPHAAQVTRFASGVLLGVVVFYSTVLQVVHASLTHDLRTRAETLALQAEVTLDSAPVALAMPLLEDLLPAYNAALRATAPRAVGIRWQEHRTFWKLREQGYAAYEPFAAELFTPEMVTEMGTVGVAPYHLGDLTVIDTLGLTDHTVARTPVERRNRERLLAHDRHPPPGYLQQRGVNLAVYPAAQTLADALDQAPYALRLEAGLWMPLSSPNPGWLEQTFAKRGLWHQQLAPVLADNALIVDGRRVHGAQMLGFFDDGVGEWSATGDAMQAQPSSSAVGLQAALSGSVGAALINSFHAQQADAAQGQLLSPVFVPAADDLLVFLVGGGADASVGVELRVDGKALHAWRGRNSERLGLVVYDLAAHAGHPCQLRIYDESTAGWGHVLADHFMLAR